MSSIMMLVRVGVIVRALNMNTNTENKTLFTDRTDRPHLPTLGLDGQVYVCMCMGRYSV